MKIKAFIRRCVFFLLVLSCVSSADASPIKTIVLDAGHGGHDPGAIGYSKSNEKDVVLDVVLRLGKLIEANYPEVKVLYTRKTDVFVELSRRADIANKNKADLFISIHCNSATSSSAYGSETFVMGVDKTNANMALVQKENSVILKESNYENTYEGFDPYSPESYVIFSLLQNKYLTQSTHFASLVQKNFTNDLRRFDRGVKQAPFLVLWRTTMPSVLIELGFLSNKEEEAYLVSDKGKTEMSKAIFKAIAQTIDGRAENFVVKENETVREKAPDSTVIMGTVMAGQNEKKNAEAVAVTVNLSNADTIKNQNPEKIQNSNKSPNTGNSVPNKDKSVVYKVQFTTVRERKSMDDYAFKSLPDVQCHENGLFFTYTAGNVSSYREALEVLQIVQNKGYKDAFIIALQNGQRISLSKARELTE